MQDMYSYTFSLRNHWWFDNGLVGLFYISADIKDKKHDYECIQINVGARGVTFNAPDQETLKKFLNSCYVELADRYWNVSDKKQKETRDVVIYYKDQDKLDTIPRRSPTPIPKLFTKGSSFRADSDEYSKLSPSMKNRVDLFLKEHNKILWGNKKRLIYEPPVCHPKIELFPKGKKSNTCCVCGQDLVCSDVSQPSFLLFASPTATLSFNSEGKKTDKICWECEFFSKFAVESAHYKSVNENLYIIQIQTSNMEKLINSHKILGSQSAVRQLDVDNYYSNIGTSKSNNRLLYFAKLPYELLWAFFYDTFDLLRVEAEKHAKSSEELTILCTKPLIETPLQIILLAISSKGQTFMLKEIISYTETTYVFRLFNSFREQFPNGQGFLYRVFQDLHLQGETGKPYDINNNSQRNYILKRILQKKPIVLEIEKLAFHKSSVQQYPYINNLLEFTISYQMIIEEGSSMKKEQVEVAVNLGKQIVISAREATKDKAGSNFDRVKGDLFALRKTRTATGFLEQLNRIQFRYNITVSNKILEGILEEPDVSFADFKSYCLLAALNTYNNIKRPKESKSVAN